VKRNLLSFAALLLLSSGCATVTFILLRNRLKRILEDVVKMSSATSFFLSVFAITIFYSAIAAVLGVSFDLKPESATMEYVWKIGDGISQVLNAQLLLALAFILLITIIIVGLRRQNRDQ